MTTDSWWFKKWDKTQLCGITQARLRPGKNKNGTPYIIRLKCGHAFYTSPLLIWIDKCPNEIPTCPCCRNNFTLQDLLNSLAQNINIKT